MTKNGKKLMVKSKIPPVDTPKQIQAWHDKLIKAQSLMEFLDLPVIDSFGKWSSVYSHDLYDIFTDEEKLKKLVSKLKLKAFW